MSTVRRQPSAVAAAAAAAGVSFPSHGCVASAMPDAAACSSSLHAAPAFAAGMPVSLRTGRPKAAVTPGLAPVVGCLAPGTAPAAAAAAAPAAAAATVWLCC